MHTWSGTSTLPRALAVLSPEPGSGKTRVLEVLELLTPDTLFAFSASVPAIFRTLADKQTTLLFDEVDTVFGRRGKDDQNEDLRALLNAGYRRGAKIPRCAGQQHEVRLFDVFAAVALAGLGDLPDTVMTRSVIVRMRRRTPGETVEPFRARTHEPQGHALRDRLAEWAGEVGEAVGDDMPALPDGIVDRPAEVWEPLIAVADAAGGAWSQRARAACVAICGAAGSRAVSLGVRLLADLRCIFGNAVALPTETLLARLCGREAYNTDTDGDPLALVDAPWVSLNGTGLDARGLAKLLRQYGVQPTKVRQGGAGTSLQGYRADALWDSWERYAPCESVSPEQPEQPEHAELMPGAPADSASGCSACSASAEEQGDSCPRCDGERCAHCRPHASPKAA